MEPREGRDPSLKLLEPREGKELSLKLRFDSLSPPPLWLLSPLRELAG